MSKIGEFGKKDIRNLRGLTPKVPRGQILAFAVLGMLL
jgi:hypothetical protein